MAGAGSISAAAAFALAAALALGCKPKSVPQAEADKDVGWLSENGSPEAMAALGRLADADPKALEALRARSGHDVNAHIAAWTAVTRNAPWGTSFVKEALQDPSRADLAASALPRRDARVAPFAVDLEGAVVRLAAGSHGGVVAAELASLGQPAHAAVERRLFDAKTRSAMCDGIGTPDASGDAKSLLLSVPPDARDSPTCVDAVLQMAVTEDVVIDWLAKSAEPGLLTAMAKGTLPCPRVASVWAKGLPARPADAQAALVVPLQLSIRRCATALDPVLSDALDKTPGARGCVVHAIDPFGPELTDMKRTCASLGKGYMRAEPARVAERASDAVGHGCIFAH